MRHRQAAVLVGLHVLAYGILTMPTKDKTLAVTDKTLAVTDKTLSVTDIQYASDIALTPQAQPHEDDDDDDEDDDDDDDDEPHDTHEGGHLEDEDETYDDHNDDHEDQDDVYDDEEFIQLLLKEHSPSENENSDPKLTSSRRAEPVDDVTSPSVTHESLGFTDDPSTGYDDSLRAGTQIPAAVGDLPNGLSMSTRRPIQPPEIDTATSVIGSVPSSDESVGSDIGRFSERMSRSSESVSYGLEQLATGASDCPSSHSGDFSSREEHKVTQGESQTGQTNSSDGQSQAWGRHARTVTSKPGHRRQSGQMSGHGGTSGHMPAGQLEPGDQRLGLHNPVVMDGLHGNGRGRVSDADNLIRNTSVYRSNDYNIESIDFNIQLPPGGSNTSVSAGSNVQLIDTQDQPADAVLPIAENHREKTDATPTLTDLQPGYSSLTGRNKTRDNLSSALTSPQATHALLAPSFSDSRHSWQLETSSVSQETSLTDLHLTPTLTQAASTRDSTQARSVSNIAASTPTLSASQGYTSALPGHQMTRLRSDLTQTPPFQPKASDSQWYDRHTLNQGSSTPGQAISTVITPGPMLEDATEHVSSTANFDYKHVQTDSSHTRKMVSSDLTALTASIVHTGLPTSQSALTDHSPRLISVMPAVSARPQPSSRSQVSATPVVEILTTTSTISTVADTKSQAYHTPRDGNMSASPSVAGTSLTTAKAVLSPASERRSMSASNLTSLHPPTDDVDVSTENLAVHTKTDPTPTHNPADVDRVVLDRTDKRGLYPLVPENTTTTDEPEADLPPLFMELGLRMSRPDLCQNEVTFREELVELLRGSTDGVDITPDQIRLLTPELGQCNKETMSESPEVTVRLYMTDKSHQADPSLTMICARVLQALLSTKHSSGIRNKLTSVHVYGEDGLGPTTDTSLDQIHTEQPEVSSFSGPGLTIAVVLAVVGTCYCLVVISMKIVVRCRGEQISVPRFKHSFSVTSSDSIQLTSVGKSRPNSGLFNPGLDLTDQLGPSNPLNYIQLSMMCLSEVRIHEEYQKIPQKVARLSVVPAGDEDKNRYANVLPLAHTRVRLHRDGAEPLSSYINANYVTGPNHRSHYYIATQGPTEQTRPDFWLMVWQQGCQVIVMLTQLQEEAQVKCASYWPELVGKGAAQRYGDFQIQLLQKDVHQEYIYSRLEINNLREIERREVDHFWYTCWPPVGVPEPISLVKLVLDTRPRYEPSDSPLVVHCSPGTGRTCTFIALDLCMRQFHDRRVVDIMKTVHNIRQERAGAVQNKEQYNLLYHAVCEYAMMLVSPGMSAASSATTLHALLQS